ncbi:hypothetical protein SDC9_122043 [bioreactor metagenome]|uniref:Uncharacterized protein n=1 Tax=bioreactor metagenome TaxID=1076179 RepID=A0A645CDU6_9ZZZZ
MFVRPYTRLSVSYIRVNSGVLVFPRRIAPFFLRRDRTVASFTGTKSFRPRVPPAETTPAESKESFSVMGTPWRGPKHSPFASARSARAASDRAASAQTWTTAFSFGFTSRIRRRNASVTSTDDISPARITWANPRTDISGISFMMSPFKKKSLTFGKIDFNLFSFVRYHCLIVSYFRGVLNVHKEAPAGVLLPRNACTIKTGAGLRRIILKEEKRLAMA